MQMNVSKITNSPSVAGRSRRHAMRYVVLSFLLFVVAAITTFLKSNPPDHLFELGFILIISSTAISVIQSLRNGSSVLSILIVLSSSLGMYIGLVFPLPQYPDMNFVAVLFLAGVFISVFMGATGYLVGQAIADFFGNPPVERSRTAIIVSSILLVGSLTAIIAFLLL